MKDWFKRLKAEITPDNLYQTWKRLRDIPGGKAVFSQLVGQLAPYTGTLKAQIEELEPGLARLRVKDRRKIRNHLRSIHAMALANLAEETSGLAFLVSLPSNNKAILTGFSIEYLKKARGTLWAEARFTPPKADQEKDITLSVKILNEANEEVARAAPKWRIRPSSKTPA